MMIAGALPAQMAPADGRREQLYTILVFEKPDALADRTNPARSDTYWSAYDAFASTLMKAGALRGGSALSEQRSTTVRGTGSADAGVKGARLGGYFVITASSPAEAEALARRAPTFAVTVEVRAHRDNPHMAKAPQ
jgi:hypothetical protein